MTRLHLPHAIVVKLREHETDVDILTPETAVPVIQIFHGGWPAHYHAEVMYLLS